MTPTQAYNRGKDLQDWYEGLLPVAEIVAPKYALMFLGMLAATSPQRKVLDNVKLAFKALDQYKHGLEWSGFAGKSHNMNLDRVSKGQALSGPKVRAFYQNMIGCPESITIDRWVIRLYLGGSIGTASAKQTARIKRSIRLASARLGVSPRQYQAAIWCGLKRASGLKGGEVLEPLNKTILRVFNEPTQGGLHV